MTEETKEVAVVELSSKAMDVAAGNAVLSHYLGREKAVADIEELKTSVEKHKNFVASQLAVSIFNAAKVDDNIDPLIAIDGSQAQWRKQCQLQRQMLGYQNPDGSYTDAGQHFYADPKADEAEKESMDWKRRNSRKNNLSTQLKQASKTAQGWIDTGVTSASIDKDTGCAMIEGGKVPAAIKGREKTPLLLNGSTRAGAEERASLAAFADQAMKRHKPDEYAEKQAKKATAKGGSEGVIAQMAKSAATDDEALGAACGMLLTALNTKEGVVSRDAATQLENLVQKVQAFLKTAKIV